MDKDLALEQLYNQLIQNLRAYHPAANENDMIRKAFETAKMAHADQTRKSGEPFVMHPLKVAIILSELRLDKESIAAALLHDVIEDTYLTKEDIRQTFGEEIMFLVDGVTKLSRMSDSLPKAEAKRESFRKLIMAAAQDIRVIIIKLADRLHNMRTLQYQKPEKQVEISRETMDLYSPIAQRLGISVLSMELEDLAFSYLYPEDYRQISAKLSSMPKDRGMDVILSEVRRELVHSGLHFQVRYEKKHLFSIYRKMVNRQKTLDELYDISALKVIVGSMQDCYITLGILHHLYHPVPNRFKDYIAMPKENMYQSLHTTLVSTGGKQFEVQIKTREMDAVAKYGVLAHWKYGESSMGAREFSQSQMEKAIWLKQILEWQQDIRNNEEFMALVKDDFDLFSETISCFTPKGDIKRLRKGSTIIDFAYAIHSDIGHQAIGAYVNRAKKQLDYVLQNGDYVEVLTAGDAAGPQKEWLDFIKTSNARSKIKKYFKDRLSRYESQQGEKTEAVEQKQEPSFSKVKILMQQSDDVAKFMPISNYLIAKQIRTQKFRYSEKDRTLVLVIPTGNRDRLKQIIAGLASLQYVEKAELLP